MRFLFGVLACLLIVLVALDPQRLTFPLLQWILTAALFVLLSQLPFSEED